ncbi:IPT/TIG domain-containing protein, partial [Aurantibacter sp.]|uniref:IPT/TIG domain-containing protein n=1 Tax=Aurantibacter sp. TaxID=2807103 RepID=UPI0035C79864
MKYTKLLFCLIFTFFIFKTGLSNNTNNCPNPVITSFSPLNGPENTLINITGTNFNTANTVTFNGINATFNIINDTEIAVYLPAGTTQSSNISITSSGGCTGISPSTFTTLSSGCSTGDLYISEIYDAFSGSYAVIELFNPTSSPIVLDGVYIIDRYGDIGNATPSHTYNPLGTIAPLDTFIILLGSGSDCPSLSVDFNVATGINDNDEFKLLKSGTIVDIVNAPNERGYTLIRNANAPIPQTTYNASDWLINLNEDCANLGSHTADPISNNTPTITPPNSQSICENNNVVFSVSVSGSDTYTYQWQILNSSGNWVDIVNDANYSGATTNTLTISNTPISFDNNQYHCEITSSSCNLISNSALLQVGNPPVDSLPDETECTSFSLPTLTNGNYFTGSNGTGTQLNAGDLISTSQTVFIYNEVGTAPNLCSNESSFTITITGNPPVDSVGNQTDCVSFTLPVITNGNYFTGPNGTDTQLNAGDVITTTQSIYIYNAVGVAPNICYNQSFFTITISPTPVDSLSDETVCSNYTLPNLTNGTYFTATNGTGTQLNAGDIISATQTIFIYNNVGSCPNESQFTITFGGNPPVDTLSNETVCANFTLPVLTDGNYFTATNGTGTQLNAGDIISTTQTIFIYNEIGTAPNNCSNESSFTITVSGNPPVDTLSNETVCANFTLPVLTNGNYFTATNGTGTQLNAG